MLHSLDMNPISSAISGQIRTLFADPNGNAPEISRKDEGLFGPASMVWLVHGDVTTMMIGGIASLMMQMLHPAVLAGVWDHSVFRNDMLGRLRRTATFIAKTTYGDRSQALGEIARVYRIHSRVNGTLPDGTPYRANDPQSLAWVHLTEAKCFLDAFIRYREPGMSRARQDRYFREMAEIGRRLGASPAPHTRKDVEREITAMRSQLICDERAKSVTSLLVNQQPANLALAPFHRLTMQAGIDLLPPWARYMHGFKASSRPLVRSSALGMAVVTRWAMAQSRKAQQAEQG